ncbi:hypothetical protein K4749_11545 [Streptomyces sp. TRM72054]|uniref:hypothetical protein n=1 Tax=Streptomyces sp. TRM72054 TaxID=2870562 RepID=UPI001C8B41DD|nr:hypothetical protein [Streptomyces sp. TRM72054]MBX9394215.1 hypothetical protein [Streptomyces sp. TRM72054]
MLSAALLVLVPASAVVRLRDWPEAVVAVPAAAVVIGAGCGSGEYEPAAAVPLPGGVGEQARRHSQHQPGRNEVQAKTFLGHCR